MKVKYPNYKILTVRPCGKNGMVEVRYDPIMKCLNCRNKNLEFKCKNCGPLDLKEWRPRHPECPKCGENVIFKRDCDKTDNLRKVRYIEIASCPGGLGHIIELGGYGIFPTQKTSFVYKLIHPPVTLLLRIMKRICIRDL